MRKFKFNRSQPKRNDSLLPAGQPASDFQGVTETLLQLGVIRGQDRFFGQLFIN